MDESGPAHKKRFTVALTLTPDQVFYFVFCIVLYFLFCQFAPLLIQLAPPCKPIYLWSCAFITSDPLALLVQVLLHFTCFRHCSPQGLAFSAICISLYMGHQLCIFAFFFHILFQKILMRKILLFLYEILHFYTFLFILTGDAVCFLL